MANESIIHFGGVRMRLNGVGELKMKIHSMDGIYEKDLKPTLMAINTAREPTTLTNFVTQRGLLEGYTTEIDETFSINRIIIFIKPMYSSYPT